MISPADGDIDKEDILKIAAGVQNINNELKIEMEQNVKSREQNVKSPSISNWIL